MLNKRVVTNWGRHNIDFVEVKIITDTDNIYCHSQLLKYTGKE